MNNIFYFYQYYKKVHISENFKKIKKILKIKKVHITKNFKKIKKILKIKNKLRYVLFFKLLGI